MDRTGIWKKILPGFIPVFVFVLADEIWGTFPGMVVAVSAGVIQLIWISIHEKRFDKFILFDTFLLVALGGVSLWLENEIFFRLKPGFLGVILLLLVGVSAFSSLDVAGFMTRRYLSEIKITHGQAAEFRKNMKLFFWILLFHTALVFYSAFFMSRAAWAFISGGLLYILFGIFFLFQYLKVRIQRKMLAGEEWLPLVDGEGRVTGSAPRSVVHNGSKLLHPVVHLHIISPQGDLLLQKRAVHKEIQPGKWDTAVGGHVASGETIETALNRETAEETGLKEFSARFIRKYKWKSPVENELVYMFVTRNTKGVAVQSDEVEELRFWTKKEIERSIGTGLLTPNVEFEFTILKAENLI